MPNHLLRITIIEIVPSGSLGNIPWNEKRPYKWCKRFHHGKESYHWFREAIFLVSRWFEWSHQNFIRIGSATSMFSLANFLMFKKFSAISDWRARDWSLTVTFKELVLASYTYISNLLWCSSRVHLKVLKKKKKKKALLKLLNIFFLFSGN